MFSLNFSKIKFKNDYQNQTNSMIAIKIKDNQNGAITHNPISIDRCCKSFSVDPNVLNISSIKDEIPRAPCNMSKTDFVLNHVQKRKAVILQGCQKRWNARKWTFEGSFPASSYFFCTQINCIIISRLHIYGFLKASIYIQVY